MKKTVYILVLISVFLIACQEEKEYLFNDVSRIQFISADQNSPADLYYSFVWTDKSTERDTIYIPVQVLGGPSAFLRQISVSQVTEYEIKYEYDNKGYVIDSVVNEVSGKAVAGTHYVAFDDPGMLALMKFRENRVVDSVPVIVLRDKSLKEESVRLRMQLETSADFQLGERKALARTIVLSDKLEKPESWNVIVNWYLGNYSVPKHELMIQVVGGKVDDEWVKNGRSNYANLVFWRGKFIEALNAFNNDPENIASGKAPMRADPENPNSELISFPTKQF